MDTIQNETQKSIIMQSTEDTEIERLDKKRNETAINSKQNTKRHSRISGTQQISERET